MKVFKLVAGILCIALSLLITLQSCAVGFGNAMFSTGEVSGSAGLIVAVMLLAGGIVMIATRKSESAGGEIANTIMIVPITIGSGIRMKILEAISNGVPVVSTSIGAQGLPLEDKKKLPMK